MTGSDRRRLLGMLAVLVALAAVVAAAVASARGADPRPTDRLRATRSLDDAGGADESASSNTSTSTSIPLDATTSVPPSPSTSTSAVAVTVTNPRPPTPPPTTATTAVTTTTGPGLAPPRLDVGPESCTSPSPSPLASGPVVGVLAPDGVHEVSLDGSTDVLVPDTANVTDAAWSMDGRRLAFTRRSPTRTDANHYPTTDLVVVDRERGCSRVLAGTGTDSLSAPAWSPDGSTLAFLRSLGAMYGTSRALETVKPDGSSIARIAIGNLLPAVWAPDGSGRISYGQDGGMRVQSRDGKVTIVDATTGGAEFQSWSPDTSKVLYTISVHQGIWVANADGSGYHDRSPAGTRNPTGIFWSRFSPDGRSIAFLWGRVVWIQDAEGGNERQLATASGPGGTLWTPAGDEVLYTGDGGVRAVPVAAGAGQSRLVHAGQLLAVFQRR
jgi:TolB protein